ncbi:MAG: hypothetical protein J2P25_03165 [Nocardiopsaceae bacterium]|nr:hypothetical protein [Nocardiopsaceae bacterium]
MDNIPAALREKAATQGGVVSREQALGFRMRQSTITSKIRSGRWRPVHRGVYATFTGPVNREAELWAALLYTGEGALLSHQTAAEVDGLIDQRSALIHLTIPAERHIRPAEGLRVHRSRRIRDLRFPPGELPRTWVEDTILDLASATSDLDEVCALVTAAFGRNKTSAGSMRTVLAERTSQRWRREIEELITAADNNTLVAPLA